MSIGGASGDQSQTGNCPAAVEAPSISNSVGQSCQKLFMSTHRPPDTSPTNASPNDRLPAAALIHALLALVRLAIANPSGPACTSLKASQTAICLTLSGSGS